MIKRRKRNSAGQVLAVVFLWLLVIAFGYVLSDLFWSMWLYFGVHWSGAENWTYLYTCTHWGALAPFVVG
jgi:hypothetical protein